MVLVELSGMLPAGHDGGDRLRLDLTGLEGPPGWLSGRQVEINDARALMNVDATPSELFDRHGFALLPNPTAVRSWDDDAGGARPTAAARLWFDEVEQLVRDLLFPTRSVEVEPSGPSTFVRRNPGLPFPYATGVHADYGRTTDDYQQLLSAFVTPEVAGLWRRQFDRDTVSEFLVINFWRTAGMTEPLQHMPLAVCAPASVDDDDALVADYIGIAPNRRPTRQGALRYNPAQRWYFFPEMRPDEVLAFKQFHAIKGEAAPTFRGCFHTAFADPATPVHARARHSCEMRVSLFIHH